MENHAPDSTVVLKVDSTCHKLWSKTLKKVLLTINGVNSVAVDREEGLVFVRGKVDPKMLIKCIEKMGKKAELASNNYPKQDNKNHGQGHGYVHGHDHDHNRRPSNTEATSDECPQMENVCYHQTDKQKANCCCSQKNGKCDKKEKRGYKSEQFEAFTKEFDEDICRDPNCKSCKRSQNNFDDRPWNHAGGSGREYFDSRANPQWSTEQPNQPDDHFYPSMGSRPPPYTHNYPGRGMPESNTFGNYFNDENASGCSIM